MDLLHQLGQTIRRLAGHPIGLGHDLAEQLGQRLVAPRRIAEHNPPGYPLERPVPVIPRELGLPDKGAGLLAHHAREPIRQPVLAARVEHRLREPAAVLPRPVAGDRQGVGLERRHPLALALRVRGEELRRAVQDPADVIHGQNEQRAIGHDPHPDRPRSVARPHPAQQAHRPAIDVRPSGGRPRRASRPEQTLQRVRHDHERVEARVLDERRGLQEVSPAFARERRRSPRPRAPARAPGDDAAARRTSCCAPPSRCPRACRPRVSSRW